MLAAALNDQIGPMLELGDRLHLLALPTCSASMVSRLSTQAAFLPSHSFAHGLRIVKTYLHTHSNHA